jgi:cysteinyl-tRNA synthetase
MRATRNFAAALVASALLGHAAADAQPAGQGAIPPAPPLASAKSWGYQLQNVDPDIIAKSPYDMIVVDYSRDGTNELALSAAEVDKLKIKPDGSRRIVLSYLSIGEAETYR